MRRLGHGSLSSLGVTLEDARDECEGMLSEALSSIGISLEDIRREAGDTFDMSLPDDRKIAYAPRAKNALVRARKEMRRLGDHADTTTPASYSDSRRQKDAAANREEEVAEERRRA